MKKCTVIIKTFLRDYYFFSCVESLKRIYPDVDILVADSGNDSQEKTDFIKENEIEYYKLPFDSGICVGRNFLIKKVKTPYVLIGDDDFQYTEDAHIMEMVLFLENNPEYDLIGGRISENKEIKNYQGFIKRKDRTLIYEELKLEDYQFCEKSGLRYKECDITFNFFIARTNKIKKVRWDDSIKVRYEHSTFFLDFKRAGNRIVFSPDPIVIHKPTEIIEKHANLVEYLGYRRRQEDKLVFFEKFDIEETIDFKGRKAICEEQESKYKGIAFLIKTFKRIVCLERLLFSIAERYPRARIIIGDDDNIFDVSYYKDLWDRLKEYGLVNSPVAYNLPFDSGLSYARNFLTKVAIDKGFKYLLFLGDDFVFSKETDILKFKELFQVGQDVGIVGGMVLSDTGAERHYEHILERDGDVVYIREDNHKWKKYAGIWYKESGSVMNFMLCKRELFSQMCWDDNIKIAGEHLDFYLRLKNTKWRVLYTPEVRISHIHETNIEYESFRKRDEFLIKMMNKNKIRKIIYPDGSILELYRGKIKH